MDVGGRAALKGKFPWNEMREVSTLRWPSPIRRSKQSCQQRTWSSGPDILYGMSVYIVSRTNLIIEVLSTMLKNVDRDENIGKKLSRSHATIKAAFMREETLVEDYEQSPKPNELGARLQLLQEKLTRFSVIQDELDSLLDSVDNETKCADMEERHYMLQDRYQNEKLIINTRIGDIMKQLVMATENVIQLHQIKYTHRDAFMTYVLVHRLDSMTKLEWELYSSSKILRTLENYGNNPLGVRESKSDTFVTTRANDSCAVCNESHMVLNCIRFREFNNDERFKVTSQMPAVRINTSKRQFPVDVKLTDDQFHSPDDIGLLIGAEEIFELLEIQIYQHEGLPHLQNTKLGYIITGGIHSSYIKVTWHLWRTGMRQGQTNLKPYYMLHHGVVKESSSTTKFRVVFNASEKTNEIYLNDLLMVGPAVQEDLHSIVLRFCMHKIVFSAGIAKMYRQVQVHPQDRHLQRIIWKRSNDSPLNSYKLKTVTYGLLGPIIVNCKIFMQQLWLSTLDWDEPLPSHLNNSWSNLQLQLFIINEFAIDRIVICMDNPRDLQLHGFSDASESAYANMYQNISEALKETFSQARLWTDSMVVLAWLRAQSSKWKTFIANRVSKVQPLTNINNWGHVSSQENPADIIMQGTKPRILKDLSSRNRGGQQASQVQNVEGLAHKILELVKASTGYCLQFIHNCKNKDTKHYGNMKPRELSEAAILCIKEVRAEVFQQEVHDLSNQTVSNASSLKGLSPLLDGRQLLRVGGRLEKSSLEIEGQYIQAIDGPATRTSSYSVEAIHNYRRRLRWTFQYKIRISLVQVHLELVSDLTPETFIASLRRFIARRGLCSNLYCDNGTNLVGAHREMKEFLLSEKNKSDILDFSCQRGIDFHFLPPSAPHMGGLWEAGIKSEFNTVLCQIEAYFNSHPLCPLSNDPMDLQVLTPGGNGFSSSPSKCGKDGQRTTSGLCNKEQSGKMYCSIWSEHPKDRDVRHDIPRYGRRTLHFVECLSEFMFRRRYSDQRERMHYFLLTAGELYAQPNL
ncbi:hypothetical protein PR048_013982, partial [Dryococelus australis]